MKKLAIFSAALLFTTSATFQSSAQDKPAPPHWAYQGEEDPAKWGDLDSSYATCKLGHEQSPIDIHGAKKAKLDPIEFHYQSSPLKVTDNGHTIMVSYAPGSTITVGGHEYTLKQFHFHHPSEERINGKPYDMVVHLVHADAEGHLAVVAVLLKVSAPNSTIQTIWDNLPSEKNVAKSVDNVSIDASQLLPANHRYYTFMGSLTTPPCTEKVTWYVLKTPTSISSGELNAFAKVYPLNARPIQPVNGRTIQVSR